MLEKLKNLNKTYLVLAIFAALVLLFYGNTLQHGFVFDDVHLIENSEYIQSLQNIPSVLVGCPNPDAQGSCQGVTHYFRPVRLVLNILAYQISSAPWIFHALELVYLFGVAWLLFVFVKRVSSDTLLAFFTGLIFLIHPLNTEVANWASALAEPLFIIFTLLALLWFVEYRKTHLQRKLVFTLVFYFLAMLSKEPAVFVVPLLVVAIDTILLQTPIRQFVKWSKVKIYAMFLVPLTVYFVMRGIAVGLSAGVANRGLATGEFSLVQKVNVFFNLFASSLQTIVYPYPLLFFHDFRIDETLFNGRFLFSFLIFALFAFAAYIFYKKGNRIASFALVWYFVFFLPMLLFFYVAGHNVFAERFLLGSTAGFALLVSSFLTFLWRKKRVFSKRKILKTYPFLRLLDSLSNRRYVIIGLLVAVLVVSWPIVFSQNKIWKDSITLLQANVERTPNAYHLRESLGNEFVRIGNIPAAQKEYGAIVEANPNYRDIDHIYNHLGNYARADGNIAEAIAYYKQAIEASGGTNYITFNNLGALYIDDGQPEKAITPLCTALRVNPAALEPRANLNRLADILYDTVVTCE